MALKSILQIDVDRASFDEFYKAYTAFKEESKESSGAFAAMAAEALRASVDVNHMMLNMQKFQHAQHVAGMDASKMSGALKDSATHSNSMLQSLTSIARLGTGSGALSVLGKMGVVGAAVAGVVAAVNEVASAGIEGQRQARGLGVNQGDVRAFSTNYERYVDPSVVNKIAGMQADMTKTQYLAMAAGVSYKQAQTSAPTDLAIKVLEHAQKWAKNRPASQLNEQFGTATGLFSVLGSEDVRRAKNTSDKELIDARANYEKNRQALNINDKFVQPAYEVKRGITFGLQEVQAMAIRGTGAGAGSIEGAFDKTGGRTSPEFPNSGHGFSHNVGNLRTSAKNKAFREFKTDEDGEKAMAAQLRRYKPGMSIAEIIGKYAPKSDRNDTEGYTDFVSKRMGVPRNAPLNLNDSDTISRLMSAMIKREKGRDITPQAIRMTIDNKTGADISVSSNALVPQ